MIEIWSGAGAALSGALAVWLLSRLDLVRQQRNERRNQLDRRIEEYCTRFLRSIAELAYVHYRRKGTDLAHGGEVVDLKRKAYEEVNLLQLFVTPTVAASATELFKATADLADLCVTHGRTANEIETAHDRFQTSRSHFVKQIRVEQELEHYDPLS